VWITQVRSLFNGTSRTPSITNFCSSVIFYHTLYRCIFSQISTVIRSADSDSLSPRSSSGAHGCALTFLVCVIVFSCCFLVIIITTHVNFPWVKKGRCPASLENEDEPSQRKCFGAFRSGHLPIIFDSEFLVHVK
jgi:hypothetical protein